MNHAEQFPTLANVLVKAGVPVGVRRAALEAVAADLAGPPAQGQGQAQEGDDDTGTAPMLHQDGWAKAFGTAEVAS